MIEVLETNDMQQWYCLIFLDQLWNIDDMLHNFKGIALVSS